MQLSVLTYPNVQGTLTHVLPTNLCSTFFQTVLDIFLFVPLVVPQTTDEIIQGFFEPGMQLEGMLFGADERMRTSWGSGPQSWLLVEGNRRQNSYRCGNGILQAQNRYPTIQVQQ
jgi:hypothetical protein